MADLRLNKNRIGLAIKLSKNSTTKQTNSKNVGGASAYVSKNNGAVTFALKK